jgi:hypothetical protein
MPIAQLQKNAMYIESIKLLGKVVILPVSVLNLSLDEM